MTVIGQLWLWPLILLAAWHSPVLAGLLALYLAYIWGPGLKSAAEAGPTPLRRCAIDCVIVIMLHVCALTLSLAAAAPRCLLPAPHLTAISAFLLTPPPPTNSHTASASGA